MPPGFFPRGKGPHRRLIDDEPYPGQHQGHEKQQVQRQRAANRTHNWSSHRLVRRPPQRAAGLDAVVV